MSNAKTKRIIFHSKNDIGNFVNDTENYKKTKLHKLDGYLFFIGELNIDNKNSHLFIMQFEIIAQYYRIINSFNAVNKQIFSSRNPYDQKQLNEVIKYFYN